VAAAANEHSIRRPSVRASHFDGAARKFAATVQARFEELEGVPVLDFPADTWQLVHDWQVIDQKAASSWLQDRIDSGSWALVDVLTRFLSRRRIMGVPNAPWTIGDLNMELIDGLLGIDKVIAALDEELSAAEHVDPDGRRLEDTYENRRAIALSELDHERRRRQLAAEADALKSDGE
jgi:hypothetical protein